jgi:TatD DNase family protein
MLIDTHCHLTSKRLIGRLDEVIEDARTAGVEKIIAPSSNLDDLKKAIEISNKYEGVYCLTGISPGEVTKQDDWKRDLETMKQIIEKEKKIVGIGEIGLDCYWNKKNLRLDKEIFKAQLEMAKELDLPVSIHNRQAEKEIQEVFMELGKDNLPKGVFHCWSGDEDFLKYVLDRGFYISLSGNVTYGDGNSLKNWLKELPMNRLLLETDSPYLSPEPVRGRLNEPKNVKITAKFVADVLKVDVDDLISKTAENSLCLFSLEK